MFKWPHALVINISLPIFLLLGFRFSSSRSQWVSWMLPCQVLQSRYERGVEKRTGPDIAADEQRQRQTRCWKSRNISVALFRLVKLVGNTSSICLVTCWINLSAWRNIECVFFVNLLVIAYVHDEKWGWQEEVKHKLDNNTIILHL